MGFYIEAPFDYMTKKDKWILENLPGAKRITEEAASIADPMTVGLICVLKNGPFDAAGFMFNEREKQNFLNDRSGRQKTWIMVPERNVAAKAANYNPRWDEPEEVYHG